MKKISTLFLLLILLSSFCCAFSLKVTKEHPFLLDSNWIEAQDLKAGDILYTHDGKRVRIKSITEVNKPVTVYNLEDDYYLHNYIVDEGLVVHNSDLILVKMSVADLKMGFSKSNVRKLLRNQGIPEARITRLLERLEIRKKLFEDEFRKGNLYPFSEDYTNTMQQKFKDHAKNVRELTTFMGEELGLTSFERSKLFEQLLMHDFTKNLLFFIALDEALEIMDKCSPNYKHLSDLRNAIRLWARTEGHHRMDLIAEQFIDGKMDWDTAMRFFIEHVLDCNEASFTRQNKHTVDEIMDHYKVCNDKGDNLNYQHMKKAFEHKYGEERGNEELGKFFESVKKVLAKWIPIELERIRIRELGS